MIDWVKIVKDLKDGIDIIPNTDNWNLTTPGYLEILDLWKKSDFNLNSVKWTNYYPGQHFPKQLELSLSEELGIKALRSWISKIDPGFMAPWHWDVDDNETEYLSKGKLVRYSCFINDPIPGQIFQLKEKYFYNYPCGKIIEWSNYKDWHAAVNFGLAPKFMYHIIGY